MFDWQREPDKKIVSDLFWVYWVFTVPLTILVALGWRVWWNWEKKKFDEDVTAELKAVDGDDESTKEISESANKPQSINWRLEYGSLSEASRRSVDIRRSVDLPAGINLAALRIN
jgi:hypothetical protein